MITLPTAEKLDRSDPLAGFCDHFARGSDGVVAYLDGNSLGRPVITTSIRLEEFVIQPWGRRLIRSWDEAWMEEPTVVGDRLGEVVLGAAAGQVVIGDSTSVLIYKLVRAAVDADPARTEMIIDRDNFPTDRFLLQGIAAERGLTVRYLDVDKTAGVRVSDLYGVLGDQTAVVVLSHVAYRSGFLADAAVITERVHSAGAFMLWDLSHSVASVPVRLDEWNVDLAVGCTYKYLNGGPGSPAFCYVRRDLQDRLQQPIWGWMGADDVFAMGPEYVPAKGILRFLSGTPPILAMQPMKAMLELIADAGMEAIRRKSELLVERAVALTDEQLAPLGVTLASPRDPAQRGSHVTITHPRFREVTARLWERGVIPDFRAPDGLRIGLSPLSTTFAELDVGIKAIRRALVELP
jgi:kynureninase